MFHKPSKYYDRYRWLRSDGTPNFNQRVYQKKTIARTLAKAGSETYSSTIPLLRVFELFYEKDLRALPLIKSGRRIDSVISVRELISLLGGVYRSLIEIRHRDNLFEALNKESARSISRKDYPMVYDDAELREILEALILGEKGYVIVLDKDNNLIGVVTERDIIELLREKPVGVKISEVMTTNVVAMKYESTLCDVLREMNILNIRRIPLIRSDGSLAGVVTARDIINFVGSHSLFKYLSSGEYEEFCRLPSNLVMKEASIIDPDSDLGEASERMINERTDYFIVVSGGEASGIVTERDIVYGYVVLAKS